MASSKAGIRYEHEIANRIYEYTGHRLLPQRDGFSGNGTVPGADIAIEDGNTVHAIELKRTGDSSQTFTYKPDDDDPGDIDELEKFGNEYPRTVAAYIGVKFDNRQLALAKVWYDGESILEDTVATAPIDAIVTRADNVSMRKPPTTVQDEDEGWPSATKGNDVEYLLDVINYTGPIA